jgi:hypothetical protein
MPFGLHVPEDCQSNIYNNPMVINLLLPNVFSSMKHFITIKLKFTDFSYNI